MKRNSFCFIFIVAFAIFGVVTCSFATEDKTANKAAQKQQQEKQEKQEKKINLYAEASDSSRILGKIDPSANLIPIFEQKGWIKVGNPKNGDVGWINKEQCMKAAEAYYRPHVKSITINITDNDLADAKQPNETKIIAYRNGKQLSDKEAKDLYEKMQKDEEQFERQMDRIFRESLKNFPNFMLR